MSSLSTGLGMLSTNQGLMEWLIIAWGLFDLRLGDL